MTQLAEFLGESPGIVAVREQVRRLLQYAAPARRQPAVLIRGETGTGKGLLAQAMHHASPRGRGPFVPINCAAIPGTLLEAELFGVEAGAFTDARQRKAGLFQTAQRGTLFLDEVGALARDLQAKLLTAIEDRVVRRVGSVRGEAVDVWVLSATSADLEAAMAAEDFRPDLYHRLATISLRLPPLRERGGDVLQLAGELLARACGDYGRPQKTLTPDAQAAIAGYRWPGNVRELANVMERVALMTDAPLVDPADLALPGSPERPAAASGDTTAAISGFTDSLDRFERAQLIAALDVTGWNVVQTAQQLGLPRTTLRHRMTKYRLARGGVTLRALARPPRRPWRRPNACRHPRRLSFERRGRSRSCRRASSKSPRRRWRFSSKRSRGSAGISWTVDSSGFLAAFGVTPVEDAPSRAARGALAVRNALAQGARDRVSWPTPSASRVVIALHAARVLTESPEGPSRQLQIILSSRRPVSLGAGGSARRRGTDTRSASARRSRRSSSAASRWLPSTPRAAVRGASSSASSRVASGSRDGPSADLVGRQDELGILRAFFERAESGQGQVVGLIGEPGVGKSRLVYEFRESLARPPVTYLEGHCLSSGSTTPYGPVLELLRQALGTSELDASPVITEKVGQHLQSLGIESETSAPYLLDLLGVKTGARAVGSS